MHKLKDMIMYVNTHKAIINNINITNDKISNIPHCLTTNDGKITLI